MPTSRLTLHVLLSRLPQEVAHTTQHILQHVNGPPTLSPPFIPASQFSLTTGGAFIPVEIRDLIPRPSADRRHIHARDGGEGLARR